MSKELGIFKKIDKILFLFWVVIYPGINNILFLFIMLDEYFSITRFEQKTYYMIWNIVFFLVVLYLLGLFIQSVICTINDIKTRFKRRKQWKQF